VRRKERAESESVTASLKEDEEGERVEEDERRTIDEAMGAYCAL